MENVELSNCIYEHIKDTFYYGLFGDFRLVIDKSTGFFNATKLCDQGVFKGNNIDLEPSDVTEQQLMNEMIMINDAKREVC